MEMLYFLLFVAVCALAIIGFVVKSHRREREKHQQNRRHTQYLHRPGHHQVLHSHHAMGGGHTRDVWGTRRRHAAEEDRGNYSITARKIQFDGETADEESTEEVSMTAIKYTPTEVRKTSNTKR